MWTILDLGEVYSLRGSVREAEFFLGQAQALSESLQAPLGVGRSLIRISELKMARGLLDEALETLVKAEEIVVDVGGTFPSNKLRVSTFNFSLLVSMPRVYIVPWDIIGKERPAEKTHMRCTRKQRLSWISWSQR